MAKILVLDDEPVFLKLIAIMLGREGHRVSTAGNGRDAVLLLDAGQFDLVVTDIQIPRREDLESHLKHNRAKDVLVIAMSGLCDQSSEFVQAASHLGACRTLEKPFSGAQLIQVTQDVLENCPPDPTAKLN